MASAADKDQLRDVWGWPQSVLDRSADDSPDVLLDGAAALMSAPNSKPRWDQIASIIGRTYAKTAALLDGSDPIAPQPGVVSALARFLGVGVDDLRSELGW